MKGRQHLRRRREIDMGDWNSHVGAQVGHMHDKTGHIAFRFVGVEFPLRVHGWPELPQARRANSNRVS